MSFGEVGSVLVVCVGIDSISLEAIAYPELIAGEHVADKK
jgi:hypothetical protein